MNRNSNGILVADNLPRAKKFQKVVSKVMRIPSEHKPVAEFMKMGESDEGYTAVYILTTSAKEAKELKRKKFTLVEQQPKTEADDEWLLYPEYADDADLCEHYEKTAAFTLGGKLYTYVGCCHVDEQHVHRYKSASGDLLVFTLYGKVAEIKHF